MYNRQFFARSFWTSKLGQASLASIAAMCAMVVFSTQFDIDAAHAATLAHPHGDAAIVAQIA